MAEIEEVRNGNFDPPAELGRLQTLALGVGVIGIIILIIGGFMNPSQGLKSYLLGYIYWTGIGVGCVGILTLQHLTGGSWGIVIRRILEAGAKTLPLLFIGIIPIILGAPKIYEWAAYIADGHVGSQIDKIIEHKVIYLNVPWFAFRAVAYFGIWGAIAYWLIRWSRQQDETGDWHLSQHMTHFSGPAMIFYVLAVSFASVDWGMSLDPHWFSTIYGLLYVIGWALSCLAFVVAILSWLARRAPMNRVLGAPHFHDLGKLMLAMVMVWTYFNLSQILIIWSGNIPEETPWYLRRMEGGWGWVGLILILFHFAFPFTVLLSRDVKRHARWLATIAVFILVMRSIDLFYLIAPNPMPGKHEVGHDAAHFSVSWMDPVAILGVGGLWAFYFFYNLRKRPLMPVNDPFFENAVAHGREHH